MKLINNSINKQNFKNDINEQRKTLIMTLIKMFYY